MDDAPQPGDQRRQALDRYGVKIENRAPPHQVDKLARPLFDRTAHQHPLCSNAVEMTAVGLLAESRSDHFTGSTGIGANVNASTHL
jgi:hypothetical protein